MQSQDSASVQNLERQVLGICQAAVMGGVANYLVGRSMIFFLWIWFNGIFSALLYLVAHSWVGVVELPLPIWSAEVNIESL